MKIARTASAMYLALLVACQVPDRAPSGMPLSTAISWSGRTPATVVAVVPADTSAPAACIGTERLEFPAADTPLSLELRRFRRDYYALAALQTLASRPMDGTGWARTPDGWATVRGEYLLLADSGSLIFDAAEFSNRLVVAGATATELPELFGSFPILGRIPGSETVLLRHYLGTEWEGPFFSVGYGCSRDTAWAFRGPVQDEGRLLGSLSGWKGRHFLGPKQGEGEFAGLDEFDVPLYLGISVEGIWGVRGCYDPVFSKALLDKLGKMSILWHDP